MQLYNISDSAQINSLQWLDDTPSLTAEVLEKPVLSSPYFTVKTDKIQLKSELG
jgi:hypothetical protein